MLQTIKDGILGIVSFFNSITSFVKDFISDSLNFIKQIPESVDKVTSLASDFFPPEILVIFVAALALVVVLRVVGRD